MVKKMIDQIEDGVWVSPIMKGYKLVCCDCGCTHRIDFKIDDGDILFRAFRVGKKK